MEILEALTRLRNALNDIDTASSTLEFLADLNEDDALIQKARNTFRGFDWNRFNELRLEVSNAVEMIES